MLKHMLNAFVLLPQKTSVCLWCHVFRLCFDPQMTGGVEHIGQHVT